MWARGPWGRGTGDSQTQGQVGLPESLRSHKIAQGTWAEMGKQFVLTLALRDEELH